MKSDRNKPADALSAEIDAALEGVDLQDLDLSAAARAKTAAAAGGAPPKEGQGGAPSNTRRGTIVGISGDDVFVELGPRVQGVASRKEFDEAPVVGQSFEFILRGREDDLWLLSRRAAQVLSAAADLEVGSIVKARVTGQNTGGLELKIGELAAFMPASQVGLRHEDNLSAYLTQTLVCQVLEVDRTRRRVLLSRRAVLEREREEERKESIGKISTGQTVRGKVTRVESFGAFVDLGNGLEGLVHVSNLSRRRVENASDVVQVGQSVEVQVLEIKDNGKRIGLGMKQLEADPWIDVGNRLTVDSVRTGKVTRLIEFGAFVELEPGLEGLLHISQLGKERVRRASDVLKPGQEVSVRIVAVEPGRQRVSLSRLDSRGAVLGSEEAVDASVIDASLKETERAPIGTNFGNLFRQAMRSRDGEKK